ILMVAITVILAAVIAAFVFGLAGSTGTSKNVGLTVSIDSNKYVVVTIQGGSDLASLTNISYSNDAGSTYKAFVKRSGTGYAVLAPSDFPLNVGQVINSSSTISSGDRVIIKGTFSDGSQQVLVDRVYG
ncbi:MAG TPA: type IV pilin, partial [Methanolinea sp.]|nr:type IV pilin [Methanolinea sp.]